MVFNNESELNKCIELYNPDVVCFGETKCQDIHTELLNCLPFKHKTSICSQARKGYSGVCILSNIDFIDFEYLLTLETKVARNYFTRSIINFLILDLLKETEIRLKNDKLKSYNDVILNSNFLVSFSLTVKEKVKEMKNYLYEYFYTSEFVYKNRSEAEKILSFIIKFIENDSSVLPNVWHDKIINEESKKQTIVDYVCGMTDQYAINFYKNYAP